jgi:hypothetical protein
MLLFDDMTCFVIDQHTMKFTNKLKVSLQMVDMYTPGQKLYPIKLDLWLIDLIYCVLMPLSAIS